MAQHSPDRPQTNAQRAFLKMAVVIGVAIALIAALSLTISDQALDELKHSLSLWTIIAVVIIINIVSFVCFVVLSAAWRWISCDLKQDGDIADDDLPDS